MNTDAVWVDVDGQTDEQMARHAKLRRNVRMDDGRIAKLVSWPIPGRRSPKRMGRSCRIEWMSGLKYRVHIRHVRDVEIPRQPGSLT